MRLAREAKQTGWWQSHDLENFATYVGLEAEAAGIKYYQSTIVPGLMQTSDYVRSIHEASIPKIAPERIDELIEVRLTRQKLLTESPSVRVEAVFDEAVLHRVVGGPPVMRAQLEHLAAVASLPNVTIQVIPYSVGAHPAMDSTFNILDFAGSVPSVVYVEGLVGWIYVERPPEIERFQQVFDHLRAIASDPEQSIDLITRMGAKY
jgi:Domain of unknown function (DUF5753)